MPSSWPTQSLKEAGVSLIDCVHKTPQAVDGGPFAYVGIPQMSGGRVNAVDARRISESDFIDWTRKALPQEHDVVLSRRCNPGETVYVTADDVFALGQNLVLLRSNGRKVHPPFLRWIVRGPDWWDQVGKFINVGAVFDSLRCRDVPHFELPLPPLEEQSAIAGVLGSLDDKIEQNRRTAGKLEELARAVFRAWFVDFAPVHAKANGAKTYPGLPQHGFDALPIAFQDSPLGPIPKGWEVKTIGDVVTIKGGGTPSTKNPEYWENGTHAWTTPKDLSNLHVPVLTETARKITQAGVDKVSSGMLPESTVLLSSRAPVGYLAIAAMPVAINQGYIAMVCEGQLSPQFILRWAENSMDLIKGNASGTTFAEISKKNFRPLPVVVPPPVITEAFDKVTKPLFDLLVANVHESHKLAELLDYLLPRLLSGAVRVRGNNE